MKLNLTIECGTTTCASEPGKFCRFVQTTTFGQHYLCGAFRDASGSFVDLFDKDGYLQRCKQCLEEARF